MEPSENEKIDKVTGQKESEIPVVKENLQKCQFVYFVLTKISIFDGSNFEDRSEYLPSCQVLGIYSDGIAARERMNTLILKEGFLPSDILYGSPEKVRIKQEIYQLTTEAEYQIWKTTVDST